LEHSNDAFLSSSPCRHHPAIFGNESKTAGSNNVLPVAFFHVIVVVILGFE
jgi:hypothetical protein